MDSLRMMLPAHLPKIMVLCAALGASVPIVLLARDFMHRPFLGLLMGAVLGYSGAILGYIIESSRGPENPARDRWLAWLCALFWGALGAFGAFYIPRLQPIFDSFGRDIPIITRLLLGGRPVFMMIFAAALAGLAFLKIKPAEPAHRKTIWACAGMALIAGYWTLWALFAPMFMGSLTGPG